MSAYIFNEHNTEAAKKIARLTRREYEVIRQICEGRRTNEEIARSLAISLPTVKTHIRNIFTKLEVRDRTALVIYANQYIFSQYSLPGSIVTHFEFPETVKVACEQYLLYFVEFLKDIGIDSTAELREDAGQVLFSVTPRDKDEALDNIREALSIYLRLPMNRNTTVVVSSEMSIEVQKVSAQIHHLQGQLYLASAALRQHELTIQQRDTTIQYQQSLIEQQITSGKVLIQALQKETEKDNAEPLGTDLIKVKPFSWDIIPLEFDLPEIVRRLKEKIKADRRKRLPDE